MREVGPEPRWGGDEEVLLFLECRLEVAAPSYTNKAGQSGRTPVRADHMWHLVNGQAQQSIPLCLCQAVQIVV